VQTQISHFYAVMVMYWLYA